MKDVVFAKLVMNKRRIFVHEESMRKFCIDFNRCESDFNNGIKYSAYEVLFEPNDYYSFMLPKYPCEILDLSDSGGFIEYWNNNEKMKLFPIGKRFFKEN